jgi:two-component system, LuxR family, sensor kinase FixL
MDSAVVTMIASPASPAARQSELDSRRRLIKGLARYSVGVLLVVAAHLIAESARSFIGPAVTSIFLAAIIIASLYGGRGPGLLATGIGALDLYYTFAKPYYSFSLAFEDFLWLVVFLVVALLTSSLQSRRLKAEESLRAAHRKLEGLVEQRTDALYRSEEQFALLVNGVTNQAVFMVGRDGGILSWNAGAERLLGFTSDEVLGKPISILALPLAQGHQIEHQPISILALAPQPGGQGWISRKDGSRFWSTVLLRPIEDSAGRPRGFAVSLRDITQQRSLEQEIVGISEREQQRIGHDIHEGVGQELTGIAMLGTSLAQQLEATASPLASDAEEVADLIHQAIMHTRDLARGLCPVQLEGGGLISALRQLADRLSRLPQIRCEFEAHGAINLDNLTASHLYRIAQEAVNNAIRHGHAHHLTLALGQLPNGLILSIEDDGTGMPKDEKVGMGLRLMEYRARAIRGSIQVRSGATGGVIVECKVEQPGAVDHG